MLTRIELDGFKTFEGFALDLSPFAVVLGVNAAGKSNLFDAVQLLSNLATKDLRSSVQGLRGDVHELFRQESPGRSVSQMRLAVEVLVDPVVRDLWGAEVQLKHTRMRYEVVIERRPDERGIERLIVAHEQATPVPATEVWRPYGRMPSTAFRKAYLRYSRRKPWLGAAAHQGQVTFEIYADGRAGHPLRANAPEATVLSSITSALDFPHLFALREEMRSWRLLQLDPTSLRRSSPIHAPEDLLPDGSNLAAVLARIKAQTVNERRPAGVLGDIGADLASIVPGVVAVDVDEDWHTREYRASVSLRDGFQFPTRVISDGTLRILALLTILNDPQHRGLVCFEEPENGVHPARLKSLMARLRELVTDPGDPDVEPGEPLSQLLMNSHSPVVLSALAEGGREWPAQILFADAVAVTVPQTGDVRRRTRIRSVHSHQAEMFEERPEVSRFEVQQYLDTVTREA